ncbi:MAG: helix-turn-helix transcriptional regulator [Paludibacteraceae bacterium]|nr:helix-turn-helix transcriptional regulator [Paludibacteraceae bacterium]
MEKKEIIEDYCLKSIIENTENGIGQFNMFRLDPFIGDKARPVPYKKRDYYKITLMVGQNRINYADKVIDVEKQALVFTNPQIPYNWENPENITNGYFCVFTQDFFSQYGGLSQYEVFQPNGTHVFELTDEQVEKASSYYELMLEEINSDYIHKYDLLRTIVLELLHFAMKMQPSSSLDNQQINANKRISMMFLELLERQFPIDENHQQVNLRSASDFASQLNIHVNHLNRAIKETSAQTTSQIIAERVLQESKILLKHSNWNVGEIATALGFAEVTHFNNFIKKHLNTTPLKFRNV